VTDESASDRTAQLEEALDEHDVTLALTPGQLVLLVVGIVLVLRILRGLRG
jgi:hypothetical protein